MLGTRRSGFLDNHTNNDNIDSFRHEPNDLNVNEQGCASFAKFLLSARYSGFFKIRNQINWSKILYLCQYELQNYIKYSNVVINQAEKFHR